MYSAVQHSTVTCVRTQHEVGAGADDDGRNFALRALHFAAAHSLLTLLLGRLAPAEDAVLLRLVRPLRPLEQALVDEDEELDDGDHHAGHDARDHERERARQVEQREGLLVGIVEHTGACDAMQRDRHSPTVLYFYSKYSGWPVLTTRECQCRSRVCWSYV